MTAGNLSAMLNTINGLCSEARQLLIQLQWTKETIGSPWKLCPICGGTEPDHERDCKLAALIDKLKPIDAWRPRQP